MCILGKQLTLLGFYKPSLLISCALFLIQPRSINCSVMVNQRMTHTQWLAWVTGHLQKPSVIAKFRTNLKTDIRRVGEIFDTNIRFVKVTKVVYFILDIQWDRISHLSHTVYFKVDQVIVTEFFNVLYRTHHIKHTKLCYTKRTN